MKTSRAPQDRPCDRRGDASAESRQDLTSSRRFRRSAGPNHLRCRPARAEHRRAGCAPATAPDTASGAQAGQQTRQSGGRTGVSGGSRAADASEPPYRLTATIQDLMDGIIDPSADVLWDSVAYIATTKGIEDRQPR